MQVGFGQLFKNVMKKTVRAFCFLWFCTYGLSHKDARAVIFQKMQS
jgi:hypothetical protein